jgi:hypothetical protein
MSADFWIDKIHLLLWLGHSMATFLVSDQIGRQFIRPNYAGDNWNLSSIGIVSTIAIGLAVYLGSSMQFFYYTLLLIGFGFSGGIGFVNILIWTVSIFQKR